ncbi:hypothetical protein [Alteribacillus sp. HJP-4]|uniref:hypothetical protein n=1 Tax=Alteribacillus sp. HJP-4 TaxID=2775394 RepID=UPI0035CD1F90
MPIICIAGADAVGKTTVCAELQYTYGAWVVPDTTAKIAGVPVIQDAVNQISRWQQAVEAEKKNPFVVLDGDIFAPAVRAWCMNSQELQPLLEVYRDAFLQKRSGFPDKLFRLFAKERTMKSRRKKSTHWRMNMNQAETEINDNVRSFYDNYSAALPEKTHALAARDETETARAIVAALPQAPWNRYDMGEFHQLKTRLHKSSNTRT